jgi:hypothetical protein
MSHSLHHRLQVLTRTTAATRYPHNCVVSVCIKMVAYAEVDEVEYKPILGEAFGPADYPLLSNHENYQPQFPPQEPTNLCTDEYPGQFNFEVYVVPNEQKTPWEVISHLEMVTTVVLLLNCSFHPL